LTDLPLDSRNLSVYGFLSLLREVALLRLPLCPRLVREEEHERATKTSGKGSASPDIVTVPAGDGSCVP
jgi:hypothetical protein